MNYLLLSSLLIIFISGMGIFFNSFSFNPLQFTCSNYVLNTYLYLALSLGIIFATVASLPSFTKFSQFLLSTAGIVTFAILSFILLFAVIFTNPKNIIRKHLMYLGLLLTFSFIMYQLYVANPPLFKEVGITTTILIVLLVGVSYLYPNLIGESWGSGLFFALIGLVIARLVELIFIGTNNLGYHSTFSRIVTYLGIGLFSLYLVYDGGKVVRNAEFCKNADYITESLDLVLDSINLFNNIYLFKQD
jgi:FtsH-binding integral membrane protein